MAYTAKGTYFDEGLSAADKAAVQEYKNQWAKAYAAGDQAAMEAAHAGAEAIRAASGYSGGSDGSEYLRTPSDTLVREYVRLYAERKDNEEKQRAASDAAVQQAVNALENSRSDTQAQYSALFRQLYLDKLRNRKNLDQKLAASGVTGGAAETTRLGYDTAYEDALRQGEQSRLAAMSDIDRAIADTRLTGDLEAANAAAKAAREQTEAYADALKYLIDRQDAQTLRQEQYAREDAAVARRYAEQERATREAQEAAEKEAEKPALTVAQVNAAIKAGVRTAPVLAAYQYYYGEAYKG